MTVDELARRAVACPDWRWMPGMRTTTGTRVLLVVVDGVYVLGIPAGWHQAIRMEGQYLPDLADPATVGCLLALVREAWGNPRLRVSRPDRSDAEALVAALEAAL